jgi:phospholipid/cholesterol/gamma-HCH transport system substrate-binding protein
MTIPSLPRGRRAVVALVIVAVVAALADRSCGPDSDTRSYCALMPDSIGLFRDSAVTSFGVPIGKVTAISTEGTRAKVTFEIRKDRRLPADVGATTLSHTLIADRRLALIGAEPTTSEPSWDPDTCITKTLTPQSITQTFAALSTLADEMNGTLSPAEAKDISRGLKGLSTALDGTGADINAVITQLGSALKSPDAAIARLGEIITDLTGITEPTADHWAQITSFLTRLEPTIDSVNENMTVPAAEILQRLRYVVPQLNDIAMLYGADFIDNVQNMDTLPAQISAGVTGLTEMIDRLPVIADAFSNSIDPATKRITLGYAATPAALPKAAGKELCAVLGRRGTSCTEAGPLAGLLPGLLTGGVR